MIYEYKCETCEFVNDVDLPINADKPTQISCPECQGPMLRVFSFATHIPNHMSATGDPDWTNKYHKFVPGQRGKMNRGGGVKDVGKMKE